MERLSHDGARGQMDNLLQQFEVCFNNPEDYLDGSVELRNSCLILNKELFSYCHDKTSRFPTSPLCGILLTKGFDNEQIWEQIQLLNEPTVKFARKKIKEITDMEINSAVTELVDDGDEPEELLNDSDDKDVESEKSDHFSDHANSSDMTSKQSTQTQDTFFNLAEMNRFLQDEDRKYENRLDSRDGDNDIDLFRELSSEEEEDNQLMYDDFFDPPSSRKENSDGENCEVECDDENSDDEIMDESVEQQLSDDDDMDDETQLSSHQKQQQKVNRFHVICCVHS